VHGLAKGIVVNRWRSPRAARSDSEPLRASRERAAGFAIDSLVDRSEYPTLNDCVYLNQASLGLIGQPAVQSMHEFLDNTARHGNFRMSDEEEVGFFESLRERGARLLNCHPDQLAITASASELSRQARVSCWVSCPS